MKKIETIKENFNEIIIETLTPTNEKEPLFSYSSYRFGQLAYLKKRCKEEGMATQIYSNKIQIFSKRKVDLFKEIIKESLQYDKKEYVRFTKKTISYKKGQALIGVMVKDKNYFTEEDYIISFVTENSIEEFIVYVFKKEVPRPNHIHVFDTKKELKNYLTIQYGLII